VIIRVIGQGQYDVDDDVIGQLDRLDGRAMAALERGDEAELDRSLDEMAKLVRERGSELPETALAASDVVIPPSDLTLDETRRLFGGEGLIPDPPKPST
jgi:PspAA-like protein